MARSRQAWNFGRRFTLWLADNGLTINSFAEKHGLKQRTLHDWVKEGVRVPDSGLAVISRATRLPADYWISPDAPYPPVLDYEDMAEKVIDRLRALNRDRVRELLEMLSDPSDLERTLALRRTAKQQ